MSGGISTLKPNCNRGKMDTSGIEPDPSRKLPKDVLSERDNQLHHVPFEQTQ